jgi:thiol-disulfide isomerase/thioredoxin
VSGGCDSIRSIPPDSAGVGVGWRRRLGRVTTGVWVLLVALACAGAIGLAKRAYDGRFRATGSKPGRADAAGTTQQPRLSADDLGGTGLGERATLVQFSSAFCQPCRATRRILADVAAVVPGVVHVEIDAESNLDLVRRLDVMRTPTTLVLDARGSVTARASGQPRKEQVLAALPV